MEESELMRAVRVGSALLQSQWSDRVDERYQKLPQQFPLPLPRLLSQYERQPHTRLLPTRWSTRLTTVEVLSTLALKKKKLVGYDGKNAWRRLARMEDWGQVDLLRILSKHSIKLLKLSYASPFSQSRFIGRSSQRFAQAGEMEPLEG